MPYDMLLQSLARRWWQRVTSLKASLDLLSSAYLRNLFSGCFHHCYYGGFYHLRRKVTSQDLASEL